MHDIESRDQIIGGLSDRLTAAEAERARLAAQLDEARKEIDRLRAELSDGIAFAFNMMTPRSVEDTRDTLDEQLSVLQESYKSRGEQLAALRSRDEGRLEVVEQIVRDVICEIPDYDETPHGTAEAVRTWVVRAQQAESALAALRSRADDVGRIERVAKYLWAQRYAIPLSVADAEWTEMQAHNKSEWMVEAHAVLVVADGREP